MKIGVLSLQGGVIEHLNHLEAIGHEAVEIKKASDLVNIDGIIIPGGESTTIGKLLFDTGLFNPLKEKIQEGMPAWGTCAGMILLSNKIEDCDYNYLGCIDITVKRNAYGRQLDSFETEASIPKVSDCKIPLVFIRAPYITALGEGVENLCEVDGKIVAAKKDNILVTAFHPELTKNLDFHKYFTSLIIKKNKIN